MTTPVATSLPPLRPGWQTTEFWSALIAQVLGLLALLGVFNVSSSVGDAIIKLAALLAAGVGATGYAVGRGQAKKGHQLAASSVINTQMSHGVNGPVVGEKKTTSRRTRGDSGLTELGILGLILLIGGIIVAVISSGSLLLLVIGIVAAVAGFLLLFNYRGTRL